MKKLILFLFLSLVISHWSFAEVRYVSHSGSNTPPYLTWETAADSIMSAINISSFGDTIYVANGVYEEQVVMLPGLSLIGAGMDSCIIDTRIFTSPQSVNVKDSCTLKNFQIIVQSSSQSSGKGIVIPGLNSIVEFNEVLNAHLPGIWCYNTNSIIRHNKILYSYWAIQAQFYQPIIDSNFIYINTSSSWGIVSDIGANPIIRGNFIIINNSSNSTYGYRSGFNVSADLYNNEFYSVSSDNVIDSEVQENITNNIIKGNYNTGIFKLSGGEIINNIVVGGFEGIRIVNGSSVPQIKYNEVWGNQINYKNHTPDSTNISADPMFVNEDSLDFHLQKYSPLIDAGDPAILDKDGSRSDIGLYGGPYGESYKYLDLAPRPPVNFSATLDSVIRLNWARNTEADFSHYNLYRDTTENFIVDSTKLAASIPDTFYLNIIPQGIDNLYFKLTAVDNQGNESNPSEELHVLLTGTIKNEEFTINSYRLFQNYPNPFNPSTKIGYQLKERGYVKLYVYDIKGELVETLVNKYQDKGYYEVEFSSRNLIYQIPDLASGVYIYQMMVRNEKNIPVFTDIKKMVYIK